MTKTIDELFEAELQAYLLELSQYKENRSDLLEFDSTTDNPNLQAFLKGSP